MQAPATSLRLSSLATVLLALSSSQAVQARASDFPVQRARIRIEPKRIEIGMFYRGAKVHVDGTAPAGYRLALVCVGQEGKVELKRKGKVGGVLWMNVGDVAFERVPSLYLAYTDPGGAPLDGRSVPDDLRLGLGYDGVEAQVVPAQAGDDAHKLFRQFISLKEREQLYSTASLAVPSDRGGSVDFSADFWLPANVPPGIYEVRMLGYRGGSGELLASEKMTAERVGLAALISSMAQQHGLLYGVLSILLAIGAGFLTGVLFGAASKKGH